MSQLAVFSVILMRQIKNIFTEK